MNLASYYKMGRLDAKHDFYKTPQEREWLTCLYSTDEIDEYRKGYHQMMFRLRTLDPNW